MWNKENYEKIENKLIALIEQYVFEIYLNHGFILESKKDPLERVAYCLTSLKKFIEIANFSRHDPEVFHLADPGYKLAFILWREKKLCEGIKENLDKIVVLSKDHKLSWQEKIEGLVNIIPELQKTNQKVYETLFEKKVKTPFGEALKELLEEIKEILKKETESKPITNFFAETKDLKQPRQIDVACGSESSSEKPTPP